MIVDLSTLIVTLVDLREIAINGLEIEGIKVQRHINNNPGDITSAAYNLLKEWRDTRQDFITAYMKLSEALDITKKPLLKQALCKVK